MESLCRVSSAKLWHISNTEQVPFCISAIAWLSINVVMTVNPAFLSTCSEVEFRIRSHRENDLIVARLMLRIANPRFVIKQVALFSRH